MEKIQKIDQADNRLSKRSGILRSAHKVIKRSLNAVRLYRQLVEIQSDAKFKSQRTDNPEIIKEAQRLHSAVYLSRGFVVADDIDTDGRLNTRIDSYREHAEYFVVTDKLDTQKHIVATARLIRFHQGKGGDSFPALSKLKLYPQTRQAIQNLDLNKCVEGSGLAKARGVSPTASLLLYRAMWQHSLRQGYHIMLIACDAKVYKHLRFLFGDALVRIGNNSFYLGSEVVPAMLEVSHSIEPLLRQSRSLNPLKRIVKREMVKFLLHGLGQKYQVGSTRPVLRSIALAEEKQAKS